MYDLKIFGANDTARPRFTAKKLSIYMRRPIVATAAQENHPAQATHQPKPANVGRFPTVDDIADRISHHLVLADTQEEID